MLLLGGIRGWTSLKKLSVQYDNPDEDDFPDNEDISLYEIYLNAMLVQGFLSSTSLESLDLSEGCLEDKHIKKLATLRWASNLKSLKLRHQSIIGPDGWNAILKLSAALTSLNLSGMEALASQSVAPLAALTNLKELVLSHTGWTGQGFAELSHSLTNLASLKAGENNISGTDRHVSGLSMPSLKVLNLWSCGLTPAFFSIKLDLPSLEILNLENNDLCVDGVLEGFKGQRLPSLKTLMVYRCDINGDWLAEFVAAGHVVCPLLEELNLSYNRRLGVAGMRALCSTSWKLKSLCLSACDLGSEEIKALAEGIFLWLQHLNLHHNSALKAEDLIALASTANMKNIKSIDLLGTAVKDCNEVEEHMVKLLRET